MHVTADEMSEDEGLLSNRQPKRGRSRTSAAAIVVLVAVSIIEGILLFHWKAEAISRPPSFTKLGLPNARDQTLNSGLHNRFWQGDELEGPDMAWANINSGHGIINLDPQFAAEQGFPKTLSHPHDDTKVVYALEAYYMIHCIQILRKDFLLIREGKQPSKPLEHAMHCFDALRQSEMCHASSQLLVITGHGHSHGFNQTRQCRSWDALREFATEHTACYWDDEIPEGEIRDRWEMCDDGMDGLPVGNLLD